MSIETDPLAFTIPKELSRKIFAEFNKRNSYTRETTPNDVNGTPSGAKQTYRIISIRQHDFPTHNKTNNFKQSQSLDQPMPKKFALDQLAQRSAAGINTKKRQRCNQDTNIDTDKRPKTNSYANTVTTSQSKNSKHVDNVMQSVEDTNIDTDKRPKTNSYASTVTTSQTENSNHLDNDVMQSVGNYSTRQLFQDFINDKYDIEVKNEDIYDRDQYKLDYYKITETKVRKELKEIKSRNIVRSKDNYLCNLCNKKFDTKITLQLHNFVDHKKLYGKRKQVSSTNNCCNRFYKSEMDLKNHQIYSHNKVDHSWCSVCGGKFSETIEKSVHMDQEHLDQITKNYKCLKCNLSFKEIRELEDHQMNHIELMENTCCKICDQLFSCEVTFNIHLKTHEQPFYCTFCKKYFDLRERFRDHLIAHIQNAMDEFPSDTEEAKPVENKYFDEEFDNSCTILGKNYLNNFEPNEDVEKKSRATDEPHQLIVDAREDDLNLDPNEDVEKESRATDEPHQVIVDDLNFDSNEDEEKKEFATDDHETPFEFAEKILNAKLKNDRTAYFSCCHRKFTTFTGFNQHMEDNHYIEGVHDDFLCKLCKHKFDTITEYTNHVISKHLRHKQIDRIKCRVCFISFKICKDRDEHEQDVHLNRETGHYHCPNCDNWYKKTYSLKEHILSTHINGLRVFCHICGKDFEHYKYLQRHVIIHTTDKIFSCDKCPKTFKLSAGLNKHLNNTHSKERQYKCEQCPAAYRDPTDLRRHRYSHGGIEKTIKCPICPQMFHEKRTLNAHLKKPHSY